MKSARVAKSLLLLTAVAVGIRIAAGFVLQPAPSSPSPEEEAHVLAPPHSIVTPWSSTVTTTC